MPSTDPLVGNQFGHYQILDRIGAGGMGVVYRAEDVRLRRSVALKLLPGEDAADPAAVDLLLREARAASALSHPNICVVYDLGVDKGRTFIVMELLDGRTLKDLIAARSLTIADTVNLTLQLADALEAAHAGNIIHGDIKPGNIFVTLGRRAKLLDFGLARQLTISADAVTAADSATTQMGTRGTIAYMSPEQARGEPLDGRTDIFSFGAVLYEMLTGHQPFSGHTPALVFDAVLHGNPEPPSLVDARVPRRFDDIVARALTKNRDHRYQRAAELLADVRALITASAAGGIAQGDEPQSSARSRLTTRPAREPGKTKTLYSLAVLPFINQSIDTGPAADYLSDGITESIINKLSQLPALRVIPRSTVFRYKGASMDPTEAASEMKARAVVIGRVLERAGRLIVSVELVDVRKHAQLWGEQYNRPLADVFEVQEAMATDISRSLQLKLSGDDEKKLVKRDTVDAEAYQAYLKGRFFWNKRSVAGLHEAVEHFQAAIDRDPAYALAYTGLADTFNLLGYYSNQPPAEAYPRAKAAAARALAIDDSIAEAHASLGYTTLFFDRDWAQAEAHLRDAIRRKPGYASAHQWLGWLLMATGRHQEMVESMRRAHELDPLSLIINAHLGYALTIVGRTEDALRQYEATLGLDPNFALTHLGLGYLHWGQQRGDRAIEAFETAARLSANRIGVGLLGYVAAATGDTTRARQVLQTLAALTQERFVSPLESALVQAGLGEFDATFLALDQAVQARISDLVRLHLLPWPDGVRYDVRFADLLARVGLPLT